MRSRSPFIDNDIDEKIVINKKPKKQPENTSSYSGKVVPVTLFTGYLGAGKTTIIANLIKNMPSSYKIAWLKNEIGNTAIDSELAKQTNVATVKEILKGCLCHYMIGSLNSALEEMLLSSPDRIVIETSGSAAPAPIVWEIRKNPHFRVDGVITVIDAINFTGYINKSFALKMQAKYTDLILINKHEKLDERTLEQNLDDLYEINLDTPKIKTRNGHIDPRIIFDLNSTLFLTKESVTKEEEHYLFDHQNMEVDLIEISPQHIYDISQLNEKLKKLPKRNFYRIKGIVKTSEGTMTIINYAFGDITLTQATAPAEPRVVLMGEDLLDHKKQILDIFQVSESDMHFTPKDHHDPKS
jgi:G3E family GTPase